jgi:hypothetical protein
MGKAGAVGRPNEAVNLTEPLIADAWLSIVDSLVDIFFL